jgi:hypothetical protein
MPSGAYGTRSNAAKYTRQGGRIWLTVSRENGDAVISVRDTGEGIPGTLLPHLFEIFTQDQRTLDRAPGRVGARIDHRPENRGAARRADRGEKRKPRQRQRVRGSAAAYFRTSMTL